MSFLIFKSPVNHRAHFPMFNVKIGGKMNIAFWSIASGRSATSCNMLAVSLMSTIAYSVKGTLVQIDQYSRALDDVFGERRQTNLLMEEYSYYSKKGIDQLADKCQLTDINLNDLRENVIPVKDTEMNYVPVSKRTSIGIDNREYVNFTKKMLAVLNLSEQINFIDCINGETPVSKAVLKAADVVVINLCQGMNNRTLDLDKDIAKKAFFLVGKYDESSRENVAQIRQRYGIDRNNIAIIPYNIHFHDAVHEGKLVSYISKSINARDADDDDLTFINSVYLATAMILRKAGYNENGY